MIIWTGIKLSSTHTWMKWLSYSPSRKSDTEGHQPVINIRKTLIKSPLGLLLRVKDLRWGFILHQNQVIFICTAPVLNVSYLVPLYMLITSRFDHTLIIKINLYEEQWHWLSNPTAAVSVLIRRQSNLLLKMTAVPKIAIVWFDWGNMNSAVKAFFFFFSLFWLQHFILKTN